MFNMTSLREQVYHYLSNEIKNGKLRPGSIVNLDGMSRELSISKTPLKEAMIKLECEGFIEILPRRGFLVKELTMQDIKDLYQIVGSLEASVLLSVFDQITPELIEQMKLSNENQKEALEKGEFDRYYQLNLDFHGFFLNMSSNLTLRNYIDPIKQRLYDFTGRRYMMEWEQVNLAEHSKFIKCLENGDGEGAALIIKDEHWGWEVHRQFIIQYYELFHSPQYQDSVE